jgi:PAS domain S-box-containing protein
MASPETGDGDSGEVWRNLEIGARKNFPHNKIAGRVCARRSQKTRQSSVQGADSDTNMEWLPNTNRWWPRVEMKQTVALSKTPRRKLVSAIRGYSLAFLYVAIALVAGLLLASLNFHDVAFPVFLFAIAITVWREGTGPGVSALILSSLAFNYFFTAPIHSFYITPAEFPYYAVFILFALLITWFSAVRRRVEGALRQSRDNLEKEVAVRTRQASLLNLTHDTIFVRDMNDIISYWNHGAEELYGWKAEDAIGKRSHELLQTIFPAALDDINAELFRTGRWEGELRHTKADKSKVVVASRWSLRRDEREQPAGVLETNNDITERKHREEEIRSLNQELLKRSTELEATNKELEAFAYSVSHDLRAPLRHIAGYAEMLQKNASPVLSDKCQRYMTVILESAKKMGMLIDDLLAFSRMGRAEARRTMVSLDQLLKEILSEVQPETHSRNIVWKIDTLPVCYGDRSMLRLVLINLISNAIKFTRQQPRAEIEIGCVGGDTDEVVVFVRDNGAGFDMKYAHKLFGVFQRLHHANEFEGTGIGLATVQRIIHRHGGKVWAESAVDQGATFYFSTPPR